MEILSFKLKKTGELFTADFLPSSTLQILLYRCIPFGWRTPKTVLALYYVSDCSFICYRTSGMAKYVSGQPKFIEPVN